MTALNDYKEQAEVVNLLTSQITDIAKLRNEAMRELGKRLHDVLLERDLLSDISWSYQHIEDGYIVLKASNDATTHQLIYFLGNIKNAPYNLVWSDDNDHVILSLVIRTIAGRTSVYLEIHTDHIIGVAKTYGLRVNLAKLESELSNLRSQSEIVSDWIDALS